MYSRFTALEEFAEEDLDRIQNSTAVVVGLGATGSVIAEHLARHGVNLIVIDRDYLEENDVYSSSIYTPEDCQKLLPKAEAAGSHLKQFTGVETHVEHLNSGNLEILHDADIILDGTDNLETRFLINEYSEKNGVPWVYTAVLAERGYSMLFDDKCFSCVFEDIKAGSLGTCETEGVMREIASIAASKTALKAVRYLAGKPAEEDLEIVPGGERFEVENPGCEVCQGENYPYLESSRDTVAVCGEDKFQIERDISENAFESLRDTGEVVADNDYLTRVEINGNSFTLFRSGRAIIEAEDRKQAKAVFDKIIGS